MLNIKVIDYDHLRDGAMCNGIVSAGEGQPEAVWSYGRTDRPVSRVEPVTQAVFAAFWDRIAASLACRGVFWRARVSDPTRLADPEAAHLIVAVVEQAGQPRCFTFAVAADETDPEFAAWLDLLGVPTMAPVALAA